MVDRCASASQRLLWYANPITHWANAQRLDNAHPGIPLIGVASTSDIGPDKVSLFLWGNIVNSGLVSQVNLGRI